eukprot:SAG11_NODE_6380_length_1325_cov_1.513866_1_plen_94_part_00
MDSELRRENAALRIEVTELRGHTRNDIHRIRARLDQCEADTFAQLVERRQAQEQTPACGRQLSRRSADAGALGGAVGGLDIFLKRFLRSMLGG